MNGNNQKRKPPDGIEFSTKKWISKYYGNPRIIHHYYREFPDRILVLDPKRIRKPLHWPMLGQPRPYFIATMPGGRVWGENGAVISPDNKLMWEFSHELMRKAQQHSIFSQKQLPNVTYIPQTLASLNYAGSNSYYFWMFEVLARFELLRINGIKIDRYLLNPKLCGFQRETLPILGIPEEKQIICKPDTHIQAEKLVLTPLVADTGLVPKWICEFLKREFLINRGIKPSREFERIYISRANAYHRKVVNEEEVMGFLGKYGFVRLHFEAKSVADQAKIFSSAKVVIAPHGAALANLVFSAPGTKVIELFAPSWVRHTYWIISQHCGIDYYRLLSEGSPDPTAAWNLRQDIKVNIKQLEAQLRSIGVI